MSIPSVKAVEIWNGIENAQSSGSSVHDEIYYDSQAKRFFHKTIAFNDNLLRKFVSVAYKQNYEALKESFKTSVYEQIK